MAAGSASWRALRWSGRRAAAAARVVGEWWLSLWHTLSGPDGHKVVAKVVVAYVGLYSLLVAHYEYLQGRATEERTATLSGLASGECGEQLAAFRNLGPVQSMVVPAEPALATLWTWALPPWSVLRAGPDRPNRDVLWRRARA